MPLPKLPPLHATQSIPLLLSVYLLTLPPPKPLHLLNPVGCIFKCTFQVPSSSAADHLGDAVPQTPRDFSHIRNRLTLLLAARPTQYPQTPNSFRTRYVGSVAGRQAEAARTATPLNPDNSIPDCTAECTISDPQPVSTPHQPQFLHQLQSRVTPVFHQLLSCYTPVFY